MESKIQEAATLILIRDAIEGTGIEVYLIDRPHTMKFLPGYSVFPGGKVNDDDESSIWQTLIPAEFQAVVPLSYYAAALRECFEEVGFLAEEQVSVHPSNLSRDRVREQLIDGNLSFSTWIQEQGIQLQFSSMRFFGYRLTPRVVSPVARFLTYFFLLPVAYNTQMYPHSFEVAQGRWISPQAALLEYELGNLKMVYPTLDSLRSLVPYSNSKDAFWYASGVGHPTPFETL